MGSVLNGFDLFLWLVKGSRQSLFFGVVLGVYLVCSTGNVWQKAKTFPIDCHLFCLVVDVSGVMPTSCNGCSNA